MFWDHGCLEVGCLGNAAAMSRKSNFTHFDLTRFEFSLVESPGWLEDSLEVCGRSHRTLVVDTKKVHPELGRFCCGGSKSYENSTSGIWLLRNVISSLASSAGRLRLSRAIPAVQLPDPCVLSMMQGNLSR